MTARIVRREDEGHAAGAERADRLEDAPLRGVVQLGGGLVRHDDAGAARDRLRERGALLLAPDN